MKIPWKFRDDAGYEKLDPGKELAKAAGGWVKWSSHWMRYRKISDRYTMIYIYHIIYYQQGMKITVLFNQV